MCTAKYASKRSHTDGLAQSALSVLLEVFRTGEGVNLIQDVVTEGLQELRRPVRAHRGAQDRTHGTRPRVLTTRAREVQLRIPKLRKGTISPDRRRGGSLMFAYERGW